MRFTVGWRPIGTCGACWELRGPKRGSNYARELRGARGKCGAHAGWAPARPNEVPPAQQPAKTSTSGAPRVEEQGSRRRRGKSRDPSRAREELGDLETWLAKVELHLINGDEKIEELDTRMEELDRGMEEFREEMQGALNQAIDKIMGEGESLKISFSNDVAALREENRFLREELDRVMGKVKDMEEQMSLVRMAILQGSVVSAATTLIAPTARVEVPKPNAFHGGRNAK
ncbi:hypothetical protein GH714_021195 [Hevea brasiliensis]|uniref:Uncharacterized protein n=1 Tax=Hevea brasiliensis TaxID=3981 RepID=A0A6A6MFU5_HEVBR|nr:hypothetical protein GH714_021195 [Hevea brasiliensis]